VEKVNAKKIELTPMKKRRERTMRTNVRAGSPIFLRRKEEKMFQDTVCENSMTLPRSMLRYEEMVNATEAEQWTFILWC